MNIAYILWQFPTISETFILNEMHFLQKQFVQVNFSLYAIKEIHQSQSHKLAQEFIHPDIYVPSLLNLKFLLSIIIFAISNSTQLFFIMLQLIKEVPIKISIKLSIYYILQSVYCLLKGIYLASILKKKNIQHIHTHYAESSGLITCIASKLSGIPFSLTLHGSDIYKNTNHKLITFLIRNSSFSVTVSQFNKNYLQNFDSALINKISVIHCGIDLSLFKTDNISRQDKFQIICIARLAEEKGIEDLISACYNLPSDLNYQCILVGDGPQREFLKQLVNKYNITDKFDFKGYLCQQDVYELLKHATVCVLPSYSEGIPVSLMESMAMGVPVISTKIKGIPELVQDGAGLLIQPGNLVELKKAILKIYNSSENELREMGSKGRRIVEESFDIKIQVILLYARFSSSVYHSIN